MKSILLTMMVVISITATSQQTHNSVNSDYLKKVRSKKCCLVNGSKWYQFSNNWYYNEISCGKCTKVR